MTFRTAKTNGKVIVGKEMLKSHVNYMGFNYEFSSLISCAKTSLKT